MTGSGERSSNGSEPRIEIGLGGSRPGASAFQLICLVVIFDLVQLIGVDGGAPMWHNEHLIGRARLVLEDRVFLKLFC